MKTLKFLGAVCLAIGVAGCATVDTASRNAPLDVPSFAPSQQQIQRSYDIQAINFVAPSDLRVSEANGYYPIADIVWRGDPIGNRGQQIGEIFQTAGARGTAGLQGNTPVVADIELICFHGVTERTRFSVGGVYNIIFYMTVRNAQTGEIIEQKRRIEADLAAPGGAAAIFQEQQGQTEKVRVTDFLTQVMRRELSGTYDV